MCFSQILLPCSMKILWELYFVDWRLFVFQGNKFVQFKVTEIAALLFRDISLNSISDNVLVYVWYIKSWFLYWTEVLKFCSILFCFVFFFCGNFFLADRGQSAKIKTLLHATWYLIYFSQSCTSNWLDSGLNWFQKSACLGFIIQMHEVILNQRGFHKVVHYHLYSHMYWLCACFKNWGSMLINHCRLFQNWG